MARDKGGEARLRAVGSGRRDGRVHPVAADAFGGILGKCLKIRRKNILRDEVDREQLRVHPGAAGPRRAARAIRNRENPRGSSYLQKMKNSRAVGTHRALARNQNDLEYWLARAVKHGRVRPG